MNEWMSEWIIYWLKSLASRLRLQNIQTYRQTKKTSNIAEDKVYLSSYSLTSLLSYLFIPSSPALSSPLTLLRFPFQPTSFSSLSSLLLTPPHYTTSFPASNCTPPLSPIHPSLSPFRPPSLPPSPTPSLPFADLPFYFCIHSNINTIVLEHFITIQLEINKLL